jgi:hypothetical protein
MNIHFIPILRALHTLFSMTKFKFSKILSAHTVGAEIIVDIGRWDESNLEIIIKSFGVELKDIDKLHIDFSPDRNCIFNIDLIRSCSKLASLVINGDNELSDISAIAGCVNLKQLSLGNCERLVDISAIACCVKLTSICIEDCASLFDISAIACCLELTSNKPRRYIGAGIL